MEEDLEDKSAFEDNFCIDGFLGKDSHSRQLKEMLNYSHGLVLYVKREWRIGWPYTTSL